jgi:hypothetical protein
MHFFKQTVNMSSGKRPLTPQRQGLPQAALVTGLRGNTGKGNTVSPSASWHPREMVKIALPTRVLYVLLMPTHRPLGSGDGCTLSPSMCPLNNFPFTESRTLFYFFCYSPLRIWKNNHGQKSIESQMLFLSQLEGQWQI